MESLMGWISVVYAAGYPVSVVLMAGLDNAYFQRKYPLVRSRSDLRRATVRSAFGAFAWPVTLPLAYFSLFARGHYGWSLRRDACICGGNNAKA